MRFKDFIEAFDPIEDDPEEADIWDMRKDPSQKRLIYTRRTDWDYAPPEPQQFDMARKFVAMFRRKHPELWARLEEDPNLTYKSIQDELAQSGPQRLYQKWTGAAAPPPRPTTSPRNPHRRRLNNILSR